MRKNPFTFLLVFLFIQTDIKAQKVHYGIEFGLLNSSNLTEWKSPNNTVKNYSIYSPTFGFNSGYQWDNHWTIEASIQIRDEGYKESYSIPFNESQTNAVKNAEFDWYHYHYYLSIPLSLYYNFLPSSSSFGLGVFAGPDLGFLIRQDEKRVAQNEAGKDFLSKADMADNALKKIDLGAHLGLRAQKKLNNRLQLFIDARINQGLTNKLSDDYPTNHSKIIHRNWGINLGVQFK